MTIIILGGSALSTEASRCSYRVIQFGTFAVDLVTGELKKHGLRVKLQDLPYRLLTALLEHPGEVVTREELHQRLWGGTVVDFDDGLHTAVRKLREVLGDSATNPRFVETVTRRGYRFIAPITRSGGPEQEAEIAAPIPPVARRRAAYPWGAIAPVAVTLALASAWLVWHGKGAEPSPRVIPLVSERGLLRSPALSPDGTQVAFSWAGASDDNLDLYVQRLDGTGRLRLTTDPASDRYPAWSPDGKLIAFMRDRDVRVIPAAGGPERKITTAEESSPCWSRDSRFIAVSDRVRPNGPSAIFLVSIDSGERRNLSNPGASSLEDRSPTFSSDGNYVAFVRKATTVSDVYIVSAAGGIPRRVAKVGQPLSGLAWSPDGEQLLFAAGKQGLFAVPAADRDATGFHRLDIAGYGVHSPSVIRDPVGGGSELAFGREISNWDIWGTALDGGPVAPGAMVATTRSEQAPSFSPDGQKLAFSSDRSGFEEIWVSNTDGSQARQLSHFDAGLAGTPKWSPDGKWVVFDATIQNNRDIYVVGSDGTLLRRLTKEASSEGQADWSHDGRWIYFMSDRTGVRQIWKMPAGGGAASQVTKGGGYQAIESPDGKTLYYAKQQSSRGIWRVPVNGGPEVPVIDAARHNLWGVADDGIYFFDLDGQVPQVFEIARPCPLKKFEFASGQVQTVATIKTDLPSNLPSFSIRHDGRWAAWVSRRERSSEIVLIRLPVHASF